MSQSPSTPITTDQLRNGEIVAADLLTTALSLTARRTVITAAGDPVSVFGRKLVGHEA